MKGKSLIILASFLVLASCDKVEKPLDEGATIVCDPAVLVPRKVLIEDLTGHLCNNCPGAAKVAEDIVEFYDKNAIVVGVHVTSNFAAPILSNWASFGYPDSSFMTDFRTDPGDALLAAYTPTGLPAGLISRKPFNNSTVLGENTWFSAASDIICKEAAALVVIDNVNYNSGSREVSADISVQSRADLAGVHRLTVYVTEDHVIDWQLDADQNPAYVSDYEHRHVLRDKIDGGGNNTALGEIIFSNSSSGDIDVTSVTGNLSTEWNASNCYLVAFVSSPDGEVLQAEEFKILP